MNRIDRQRGMTGVGWLTVLALIGFFAMLILKLAPVYMEHYSVKTVLASLKEEPLITTRSVAEVRRLLKKRLTINGVYDMKKEAMKIKKEGGVMRVRIAYEVRKHMVGNVDVVISFDDQVELVSH
ncbi:MAG TPA: DUF4845 domain-containing protein [Sedimenticola thiotaurini]|uniref:DUF4845 domain-containing protein n=1 Tax=Sedimenticola thiotaurini TaxID=1543721 RepID=A0A831W7Z2_9GAMM|nr:DUF4845 domain-containing protein [Sedimenticola thiotaurini]